MALRKSLRFPCRIVIILSFFVIFIDWALLLNFSETSNKCTEETNLTLFGAGCLFGYVPILTAVAILKQHMARKGLLLASAVSSVILAIYDFSQASQLKCDVALGVLLIVQGSCAGLIVFLSLYMWFFLGRPGERLAPGEESESEVAGQSDLPPDYDRAVRAESHIIYRVQTKWESFVFRVKRALRYDTLRTPLVVSGANLDRIMVGISTTTICIVILQVILEVVRVSARQFTVQVGVSTNTSWTLWCNEEIPISCICGLGYFTTLPSFILIMLGVQFRRTRGGLRIPGLTSIAYLATSFLTFLALTALAMLDLVILIGQAAFNNKPITPNTQRGNTLLISAEGLTAIQSLMSIAGAALAMVAFYVMGNNLFTKLDRHSSSSDAQNSSERRRTSSNVLSPGESDTQETIVGIENEAFTQEEGVDSKLPSYDMARKMGRRRQSLPDLSKRSIYLQLPGTPFSRAQTSNLRRTNSFNLEERNMDEPPPYRT